MKTKKQENAGGSTQRSRKMLGKYPRPIVRKTKDLW